MLWIALVLFVVGEAVAQKTFWLACPSVGTVQDFVVDDFMGKWYVIAKYPTDSADENRCTTATYTAVGKGVFDITITQISPRGGKPRITKQQAIPIGNPRNGKFNITPTNRPFWVVAKDDNVRWMVVWSCLNDKRRQRSLRSPMVLSTSRSPSDHAIDPAFDAVDANGFDRRLFTYIDQKNCPS